MGSYSVYRRPSSRVLAAESPALPPLMERRRMVAGHITSEDALLDRADRAIADAIATRAEVRAGLAEAALRIPHRVWPKTTFEHPKGPDPLPWDHLDPWCALARAMVCAGEIVRGTDSKLEHDWRKALPAIETPLALLRE